MGRVPVIALTAQSARPDFWGVDEQLKSFGRWLLVWVVLVNAGFAILWFSGAPPRHMDIVYTGILGLVVMRASFWLRYAAFAGALIYSTLRFIGGLFNLDISSLLYSLKFFAEIKPANSYDYIGAAIAILAIMVVGWRLLKREAHFSRPLLILKLSISLSELRRSIFFISLFIHQKSPGTASRWPEAAALHRYRPGPPAASCSAERAG